MVAIVAKILQYKRPEIIKRWHVLSEIIAVPLYVLLSMHLDTIHRIPVL